jgi:RAP domain
MLRQYEFMISIHKILPTRPGHCHIKDHQAPPSLLDAIARAALVRIDEFNPQALSNTAWAFAKLNHGAPALFDAIESAAPACIGDFTPQNLANTAWAFASLNQGAPGLLDAIAKAALVQIHDFNPQALSNTAWSFAMLNHETPPLLLEAIARAVQIRIHEFNPQALTSMAWSFAVFDMEESNLLFTYVDSPLTQALQSIDPSSFSVENLCRLPQFQLWCQEQQTNGGGASNSSSELRRRCREAFVLSVDAKKPSRLQNDVMESLRTVQGISQVEEEVSTDSGYSVDAVVMFRGERIAVEVDGPFHFVGQSQSPNGATALKHRQLRALEGWKLVAIPYWEWNGIDTGPKKERTYKKQRYLQNLLDEALVAVSR